ncbi:MAG: acyltransferase [Desulfobulbaceae bacterium]|nr:acyltransferase [Desulfobulbaceae bacterium]
MNLRYFTGPRSTVLFSFILLSVIFFSLVSLSKMILPGASRVTITVLSDHAEKLQLFYWNGVTKGKFWEKYSVRAKEIKKDKRQKIIFSLKDHTVNRVRLDLGTHSGVFKIYQLVVYSHFAKTVVYSPADIYRIFLPGQDGTQLSLKEDYVEVIVQSHDPYLVSTEPLNSNLFLLYCVPLFVSVLIFLVLKNINFSLFPAFCDIGNKKPSSGMNVYALDGLRGVAAVMVVADHSWGRFTGQGAGGVWLFMSLSGFLLARPFIRQPKQALSLQYWSDFFLRRIRRIVPAYYVYIIVIYVLTFRSDEAIRHFLFLQGSGHLWVVPQEVLFYLLTPIIMVANVLFFRNRIWVVIFSLTLLMVLANAMLDKNIIALYGMTYKGLRPFIGVFLAGMIASYLYYGIYEPFKKSHSDNYRIRMGFTVLGLALLLFFLLGSTGRLWGGHRVYAQIYFEWFGVAAGALLFIIVAADRTPLNRILSSLPLRAIGVVSFSLYLFHPLVLNILHKALPYYCGYSFVGFPIFFVTLCVSYLVACIMYTYIERPFLHLT